MRLARALRAGSQCRPSSPRTNFRAFSSTSERVFVGLGANLGDRAGAIQDALQHVSAYAKVVNTSFLYQTTPMYVKDQPHFLNAVAELQTSLQPYELLQALKRTESELGRDSAAVRFGPRSIDLDLLLYGERVTSDARAPHPLQLPHPRIAEREFVLRPLCDISPRMHIPGVGEVSELLNKLPEKEDHHMKKVTPILRGNVFEWGSRTLLMGIINVTPDSFSDGGDHAVGADAVAQAGRFVDAGFDIIDVGGQSTRPGAGDISASAEQARVLPVIDGINAKYPTTTISVDTFRASTAKAALGAGARIVNDVSAGAWCTGMHDTLAVSGSTWIAMHTRGRPAEMAQRAVYQDVVGEISAELGEDIRAGIGKGIARWNIIADAGIGFAKGASTNRQILREWTEFRERVGNFPTLLGLSRKSFLGRIGPECAPRERDWLTAGAVSATIASRAVDIVRIHEPRVAEAVRAADFVVR